MTCFTLSVSYVQENLAEHAIIVKKTMAGHKKINKCIRFFSYTKKVERTFGEAAFLRRNPLKCSIKNYEEMSYSLYVKNYEKCQTE